MQRNRAAVFHLVSSLLLLAACAALVMFAWYPHPFLNLSRPGALAAALVIAVSFIAPALTWLVSTPGKSRPKLVFDLLVIGLIQVSAMAWGMYNLSLQKPYFMVFTLDRFEALALREVTDPINDPAFLDKPFSGPVLLYAEMPDTGSAAYQRLLQEVMFEGKPDLQFRPEFWSPYAERQHQVLEATRPLAELKAARPKASERIDDFVNQAGGDIAQLAFVPGRMGDWYFTAVLDGTSGEVVGYLDADPWIE